MGPEKRKDELPADETAERDREGSGRNAEEPQPGAAREATDAREEEGWSQPESSAQKEPERGPSEG